MIVPLISLPLKGPTTSEEKWVEHSLPFPVGSSQRLKNLHLLLPWLSITI